MHALPEDVCVLCLLTHGAQLAHPPRPAGFPPHLTYSCGVQCTHGSALLGGAAPPGLSNGTCCWATHTLCRTSYGHCRGCRRMRHQRLAQDPWI